MQKLLIIGYVWPEPNSSAAGSRMMQLIEIFHQLDFKVHYASPAAHSEHMVDLKSLNIEQKSIELNNSSFDDYVKALAPDVVLFDRFMMEEQFSWRVDNHCPNAVKILETVDLHCLRHARHEAIKNSHDANDVSKLNLDNDIALREVASILRCDMSLMISSVEVDMLLNVFNIDKALLLFLPFMYDSLSPSELTENRISFHQREHFVTIGNFRHAPNWDSVLYLKNTIWPEIRKKLKKSELHIYGSYSPKKAQQLHNEAQGFHIKGWAEDALETLGQYRVCLSPIRFGAGMKGKLADAMLSGTPSITTSIGAESMSADYAWPGFISDEPEILVSSAIELHTNENLWHEKQNNILPIINNRFNKHRLQNKFITQLKSLSSSLQEHRNKNFTGKMLRHHTMKSARYMSQWIEEKNKK